MGKQLEDNTKTLTEYNIAENAIIVLFVTPVKVILFHYLELTALFLESFEA